MHLESEAERIKGHKALNNRAGAMIAAVGQLVRALDQSSHAPLLPLKAELGAVRALDQSSHAPLLPLKAELGARLSVASPYPLPRSMSGDRKRLGVCGQTTANQVSKDVAGNVNHQRELGGLKKNIAAMVDNKDQDGWRGHGKGSHDMLMALMALGGPDLSREELISIVSLAYLKGRARVRDLPRDSWCKPSEAAGGAR
jgi:hypothetical protein